MAQPPILIAVETNDMGQHVLAGGRPRGGGTRATGARGERRPACDLSLR